MTADPSESEAPKSAPPAPTSPVAAQAQAEGVDATFRAEDAPTEQVDVERLHAPIMREKSEPRDGYEPVPLWLVAVFGVLLFWGGWYLASYSGNFSANILDGQPPPALTAQAGPKTLDPVVLGQRLFQSNCVACHTASGTGQPGLYPPLAGSEWAQGSPARVTRILLHGLEGPITVEGQRFNNSMPPFGARFSDDQIAAVLTYVRTNKAWGNDASPITPAQVAAARAATSTRGVPFSPADLLAVTSEDLVAEPPAVAPATSPAHAPGGR